MGLLALAGLLLGAGGQDPGWAGESSFEREGVQYRLTARSEEVTTRLGRGLLVRYSVFRGEAFLHSEAEAGGRLFGVDFRDVPEVRVLSAGGKPLGWLVRTLGTAGNTRAFRCHVVVPSGDGYAFREIRPKEAPQVVEESSGAILRYTEQCWGRGGTASSVLVPRRLRLDPSSRTPLRGGKVREGLEGVPFLPVFAAGIRDLDPELMTLALERYDPKDASWIEAFGLPPDRKGLEGLVGRIRTLREGCEEIRPFVDWGPEPLEETSNAR